MEQCDGSTAGGDGGGGEMRECTKGCGLLLLTADDREHNCLAELRTCIEVLRMELLGKLEHQRQETQLLLDNQRGHMIQREAMLQASIQQLKEDLALVSQQVKLLLELDHKRSQDLERLQQERVELLDVLNSLQAESTGEGSQCCERCERCASSTPDTCTATDNTTGRKVTTL